MGNEYGGKKNMKKSAKWFEGLVMVSRDRTRYDITVYKEDL